MVERMGVENFVSEMSFVPIFDVPFLKEVVTNDKASLWEEYRHRRDIAAKLLKVAVNNPVAAEENVQRILELFEDNAILFLDDNFLYRNSGELEIGRTHSELESRKSRERHGRPITTLTFKDAKVALFSNPAFVLAGWYRQVPLETVRRPALILAYDFTASGINLPPDELKGTIYELCHSYYLTGANGHHFNRVSVRTLRVWDRESKEALMSDIRRMKMNEEDQLVEKILNMAFATTNAVEMGKRR